MVQDSGGVPLSVKGVVIGLNSKSMDVVWDVAFMSGATMGDRFVSNNIIILFWLSHYPSSDVLSIEDRRLILIPA